MIKTFDAYAYIQLREYISSLLNEGKSFSCKLIVDTNNQPQHWEVEEL